MRTMTRLLTRDAEMFARRYTDAAEFVRHAEDRKELYALAVRGFTADWPTDLARMRELLSNPWCREPWFIVQLRGDAKEPVIESLLQEVGV